MPTTRVAKSAQFSMSSGAVMMARGGVKAVAVGARVVCQSVRALGAASAGAGP